MTQRNKISTSFGAELLLSNDGAVAQHVQVSDLQIIQMLAAHLTDSHRHYQLTRSVCNSSRHITCALVHV